MSANLSRQASWLKRDQYSITFEIQRRFLPVNTEKLEAVDSLFKPIIFVLHARRKYDGEVLRFGTTTLLILKY